MRAARTPRLSLSAGLRGSDNALGLVRLVLAASVIFSHSFPLGGFGDDPLVALTPTRQSLGSIAVVGFFAASGYLITKSGTRTDVWQFVWHRALRIFPAFWAALAVGGLVVAPAVWAASGRPLRDLPLVGPGSPVAYLSRNYELAIRQYGVLDTFATTTPYGRLLGGSSVLNGSIWTLDYEWLCYLLVGALVSVGLLRHGARAAVGLLTLAFLGMHLAGPARVAAHLPFFADTWRVELPLVFLLGACLAVWSHRVPCDGRLGALAAVAAVAGLLVPHLLPLAYAGLAYLVLWLAAALPAPLRRVGARNDYSYGVYVYGFLVGQTLAHLGATRLGYLGYALLTLAVTAVAAWLSWHLVERPALSLKTRGPGRGAAWWEDRLRVRLGRRPGSSPLADAPPAAPTAAREPVTTAR